MNNTKTSCKECHQDIPIPTDYRTMTVVPLAQERKDLARLRSFLRYSTRSIIGVVFILSAIVLPSYLGRFVIGLIKHELIVKNPGLYDDSYWLAGILSLAAMLITLTLLSYLIPILFRIPFLIGDSLLYSAIEFFNRKSKAKQ